MLTQQIISVATTKTACSSAISIKYEKPQIIKEEKMIFPMSILQARTGDVVCKQCSSCHGCK